ncbi:hypothetical protein [Nocardioides bigeumensis]|uniref:HTH luxR-type domain-containing protein n=1 Tax=Nocardioides bigeumensis TaxID=433657 RepID=A0ABN2Y5Y1_9ACTN
MDPDEVARLRRRLRADLERWQPAPTEREAALAECVLRGLTNAQTAEQLGMPLEQTAVEVTRLVDRLMAVTLGRSPAADTGPSPGKHRRDGV